MVLAADRMPTFGVSPDGVVWVHCVTCGAEIVAGAHSTNEAIWIAERAGWDFTKEQEPLAYCPNCVQRGNGPGRWEVWCRTCDAEDSVDSEEEAKAWEKDHNCRDWVDPWWPEKDTGHTSPQERMEWARIRARNDREYKEEQVKKQELALRQAADSTLASMILEVRQVWWRRWLLRLATWGKG